MGGPSCDLSGRELAVLAAVACGLSDNEIARELGISLSSTRYCVRMSLTKLGAVNRPHAVARAVALGFLTFRV